MTLIRTCSLFALSAACGVATAGGNFAITSYTIDCGGGTSSGGTLSLIGVIGQPDAGPELSGSTFTLRGGFLPGVIPTSTLCPGDANGDQAVNFADLEILLDNWATTVPVDMDGDFNGDATVNFADLEILLDAWGSNCNR